ncbi:MAG: endopeptidase La, partial [Burkholderiales bacterium]
MVLFPGLIMPITIGRESTIAAAQEAVRNNRKIGVLLQRDPHAASPVFDELYHIGTVASILRYVTAKDGAHHLICQGEQRFRLLELLDGYPFPLARVELFKEVDTASVGIEARMLQLKKCAMEILNLMPQAPEELTASLDNIASPSTLADFIAGLMDLKPEEKQDVLESLDLQARLDKVLAFLMHRLEVMHVSQDISQKTRQRFEEQQREILLREQMKTIQKQLGETGDDTKETAELDAAIGKAGMPEEVEKQARKELKRLERMPDSAGEYAMLRTYLDWLIELPWSVVTEDRIDIAEARQILDDDHYGLQKIKRRILEYLAVRKLNPHGKSPILCFVGPPGVGKTSLGHSIAKATGRKFVRISMGGVHDEAEIRGHRRTYIGALPGNVIQAIRKAGAKNCVMMLDEVDKLGASAHGDPSSALQCQIADAAIHAIIGDYTREAGVRNLEREIGSVFRHSAMRIAEGEATQVQIDAGDLQAILGPSKFESELAMRTSVPGVATGLAWTPVGGDILFIEASRTPGNGRLILTGQLGDVMKESAQAALTLLKAHSAQLNIAADLFEHSDIHVHVPAGAIPKDGPSAGVAMFIALASLFTDRKVRTDTAMTGEISLRGLVLPVGGIKEKVLAAMRAGIS